MNNMIKKTENGFDVVPFEKCVVCDKETDVPVTQHIVLRKNYIEGGGQLCECCYNKLDDKKYILV